MNKFTLNGETIESDMSIRQAKEVVARIQPQNEFLRKLCGSLNPTSPMVWWLYKKATEQLNKEKGINPSIGGEVIPLAKIAAMFEEAKKHLKFPKIRLEHDKQAVTISPAPATGNNPGAIYVKVNGEYAGKIVSTGQWFPKPGFNISEFLAKFAADPKGEAIKYGHLTGNCCFCSRTLTADDSLAVGYGAHCAARWGLPHGNK